MRQQLSYFLLASAAAACAATAAAPAFEFRPGTGPLRYSRSAVRTQMIETPMGSQEGTSGGVATIVLDIGEPTGDGLQVSAVFESLEVDAGEAGRFEGGDLLGQRFSGILSSDGMIVITYAPETPSTLRNVFDPKEVLANLMLPLPPEADAEVQSWPVNREWVSETAYTIHLASRGTARVVGDTTWNGLLAKVIIDEGEGEISGSGSPPGGPGEIEFSGTGSYTSRYLWDPERGIMLESVTEATMAGELSIAEMGMVMPFEITIQDTAELQRR